MRERTWLSEPTDVGHRVAALFDVVMPTAGVTGGPAETSEGANHGRATDYHLYGAPPPGTGPRAAGWGCGDALSFRRRSATSGPT